MPLDPELLSRFHRALVDEIRRKRPEYLDHSFTVAEIYEDLVPYRTHRNVIGVAMNGDYEDALLRLLAGEGNYLVLDSEPARRELQRELESSNPNTALYRDFATVDVRLNPAVKGWVGPDLGTQVAGRSDGEDVSSAGSGRAEAGAVGQGAAGVASVDAVIEGDEVGGSSGEASADGDAVEGAVEGAAPHVEPSDALVADTGSRIWAIEDSSSEAAGGDPLAGTREGESPGEPEGSCSWCGELLPERPGMSYCPHCGGDIRLVPCPACGEALERSWRFCVACGAEVAAS
jgi:hypothetical protein